MKDVSLSQLLRHRASLCFAVVCCFFFFLFLLLLLLRICVCIHINSGVYCREHMAPYTIPTGLVVVEEMPRNQMGKVNKKDLLRLFFS